MGALLRAANRIESELDQVERRQYSSPATMTKALDASTVRTPALDLLDQKLTAVACGDITRLIWSMPPQEGKSEAVSRRFPLWMLCRNPDLRIGITSYELNTARRWGRRIRNDIAEHPELGLRVRNDTSAAQEWQLEGHRGGVYSVGIGGALTGRPLECFPGDTRIVSERGYCSIRDLHQSAHRPRVLSFNHETGRAEWRRIVATRAIPDRPLVEVVTSAGRRLTCTPDHRVYTPDGYRPAALLRRGDHLIVGRPEHPQGLRGVRQGAQDQGRDLPRLLHAGAGVDVSGDDLFALRNGIPADARRSGEAQAPRAGELLLLSGMREGEPGDAVRPRMCDVQRKDPEPERSPLLLAGVPARGPSREADDAVPTVFGGVRAVVESTGVLLAELCEHGARVADGRQGQLPLQGRVELRGVVPADAPSGHGTRPGSVPGVLYAEPGLPGDAGGRDVASGHVVGASPQRGPVGQPPGELDHTLSDVPCGAPQVGYDTVSVVRHLHGVRDTVYDLQVEGNRNFFAEEVLVHNCLIIDDPVKGRAEADSETYREDAWEFWTETARTRLAPGAFVVVIMTRWHEDDLAGRLIAQNSGWEVINIPAQCDTDDDPLGREHGEYLVSARGRTLAEWEQVRRDVGERGWTALYQGRPAPAEGGLLKRAWWRYDAAPAAYTKPDGTMSAPTMDVVIQSWDMAFKDTSTSDYVVGQVWGRRGAEVHLLDQVRDRLDFPATCRAVQALSAKWPGTTLKLIEDKANGTAVIAQLRQQVPGMVPVSPKDSKAARVAAVSPFVEAGNVFLPDPSRAPWVASYLEEASGFPNAAHDDQVDATTQAINRLLLDNSSTGFLDALVNSERAS